MNNWELLQQELKYYGIKLSDNRCIVTENGKTYKVGIVKILSKIEKSIRENGDLLSDIYKAILDKIVEDNNVQQFFDPQYYKLFVYSLEDLLRFSQIFENKDDCADFLKRALDRDILGYSKEQIQFVVRMKICLDWIYRLITRLLYVKKLLSLASMGEKRVLKYKTVTAAGFSGPWSNLDLPMAERVFPFDADDFPLRTKEKQKQRRYRKGFDNYHHPGVSEGHYWREMRNEPYLWSQRGTESPYPGRSVLTNWG